MNVLFLFLILLTATFRGGYKEVNLAYNLLPFFTPVYLQTYCCEKPLWIYRLYDFLSYNVGLKYFFIGPIIKLKQLKYKSSVPKNMLQVIAETKLSYYFYSYIYENLNKTDLYFLLKIQNLNIVIYSKYIPFYTQIVDRLKITTDDSSKLDLKMPFTEPGNFYAQLFNRRVKDLKWDKKRNQYYGMAVSYCIDKNDIYDVEIENTELIKQYTEQFCTYEPNRSMVFYVVNVIYIKGNNTRMVLAGYYE
jgi:hypothetical protein